ncbi:AraC family transcriptional regulator [Hyphomicrobium sp.]|uniref:helix-turn-helix domain-containing protein n=1 Tax=Hyphomicrobium sp. TaxID=82 RepID=UPI002BDE7750|nr:AraC family transcriptional regulator [Hyphomicrobium sp.]HRN88593.1 AraC family transcriptional regulator [Hyphomicrobium sp.]HRQ27150.1 AraC family transcriptional regulator [Hyphomicrobium sp.]
MQNSIVGSEFEPDQFFVGALEGRSCCSGLEEVELWPKLIINCYLSGGQSFAIDGVNFSERAHPSDGRPRISMINIRRRTKIQFKKGDLGALRLRKVKLSIPEPWLQRIVDGFSGTSPALHRFFSGHLSHFAFDPTLEQVELAEQISQPPATVRGEFLTLYRKARAIELMRLSFLSLVAQGEEIDHKPSLTTARHCERVRTYILANLSKPLTIEAIARDNAASVSSVQRHFKQHYGVTVFDFIRRKRLEAAREALEARGVTVAEAAWIAGYTSSSSFITAFKKTFGTCPGEMRA